MSVRDGGDAVEILLVGLFLVACFIGFRSTHGAIAAERSEGTLGFLFLTDLRPSTVLFAKTVTSSLQSVLSLLAVIPILATCILAGGVSGTLFLQATLAILYALALSSLTGLLQSCLQFDTRRAYLRSAWTFGIWCVAPVFSPVFLFIASFYERSWYFWGCLIPCALNIWHGWRTAVRALEENWRETEPPEAPVAEDLQHGDFSAPDVARLRTQPTRAVQDPGRWLIAFCGESFVLPALALPALIGGFVFGGLFLESLISTGASYLIITFILRGTILVLVGLAAPDGIGRAVRGDRAEALAVTPLGLSGIVRGADSLMIRRFGLALAILTAGDFGYLFLVGLDSRFEATFVETAVGMGALFALQMAAIAGIASFGIWMGLRAGSLVVAVSHTVLVQLAAPLVILSVGVRDMETSLWAVFGWYVLWIAVSRWRLARYAVGFPESASARK